MGVLNATPDSFSDGGQFFSVDSAFEQVKLMIESNADIIDIGGESSRPGAAPVSLEEELKRTIPIIKKVRKHFSHKHFPKLRLSIDTTKPEVMRQAILEGCDLVNDISGFFNEQAIEIVKHSSCQVCVMHMQGSPANMQTNPQYGDIVSDMMNFFQAAYRRLTSAGIQPQRIIYDPGFGFGKTLEHNIQLFQNLSKLQPT